MTPDDLRALADALEPMAKAPRFEDFDVPAFCAWVRAQAEAEPVAWIVEHGPTRRLTFFDEAPGKVGAGVSIPLYTHPAPAVPAGWKLVPVEPTPEMLSAVGMMDGYDWHAPGCSPDADHANWYSAMIAAAPAAPQAEPKRDWSAIDAAIREYLDGYEQIGENDAGADACYTPTERELYLIYDAINGLLADESFVAAISAPQAEPKPTPASGNDLNVYKEMADNYRNDAEPTGAPYGIIDPDYGRVYTIARKLAWEEGYAIGLHGSFTRDLDLIAVPWAERACEAEHLIRRIVDATGLKLRDGVGVKPHGRRAWTLLFPAFGDPRFVDLSVMPRIGGSDAQAEPKREPLGDWRIAEEVKNRQIYGDGADAFYEGVRWAEHSHGIGGSDAE